MSRKFHLIDMHHWFHSVTFQFQKNVHNPGRNIRHWRNGWYPRLLTMMCNLIWAKVGFIQINCMMHFSSPIIITTSLYSHKLFYINGIGVIHEENTSNIFLLVNYTSVCVLTASLLIWKLRALGPRDHIHFHCTTSRYDDYMCVYSFSGC